MAMHLSLVAVIAAGMLTVPLRAAERQIDPEHSVITVRVEKSGLLAVAGHEHTVLAPIANGVLDDEGAPRVRFRILSTSMAVQPEEHLTQIQQSMQEHVLESARYPEISFASQTVEPFGKGAWVVSGALNLHGQSHQVHLEVHKAGSAYVGKTTILQTDFGIQPVSAAGGTIKVKNELKIEFSIVTR